MGWESGYFMHDGDRNVMMGTMTGRVNNGSDNTFLGFFAGAHTHNGSENTFVGSHAGSSVGSKNTMIGYYATSEPSVPDIENATAIGYRAVVMASNALEQNVPNPYTRSTEIGYQVPENAHSAFIKIYSITGGEIETFDISGQTEGTVTLSSDAIPMGTYVYQLWVDGQLKDSKKLIQAQ